MSEETPKQQDEGVKSKYRPEPVLVASVGRAAGVGHVMRAEKQKPKECVLALEMLAEGYGADDIREKTGLGWDAISGLRARHEVALDVRRRQMAADGFELAEGLRLLAKKKMKMLSEDDAALAKVSLKDLILSNAIAQDKGLAAIEGGAKTIIEHRSGKPSLADAMKAISDARKALQKEAVPVEAKVVDV